MSDTATFGFESLPYVTITVTRVASADGARGPGYLDFTATRDTDGITLSHAGMSGPTEEYLTTTGSLSAPTELRPLSNSPPYQE